MHGMLRSSMASGGEQSPSEAVSNVLQMVSMGKLSRNKGDGEAVWHLSV